MSAGPDESTLFANLEFARETSEERAARIARLNELIKEGLHSEEKLDEYARLLGLRYDADVNNYRAK